MRVNARLDEESQQQVDYLTAATGMPVSRVLRESIGLYYRQVRAQRAGIKHLAPLIGRGDSGRSDIAGDVKRHLGDALAAKQHLSVPATPRVTPSTPAAKARRPPRP